VEFEHRGRILGILQRTIKQKKKKKHKVEELRKNLM